MADWMGVTADDPGGGYMTPPVVTPPPSVSADPISDLLTRFLPQMRAAFIQRSVPADRLPSEVYQMQGRALMAEHNYAWAKAAWDTVRQRDPLDVTAMRAPPMRGSPSGRRPRRSRSSTTR